MMLIMVDGMTDGIFLCSLCLMIPSEKGAFRLTVPHATHAETQLKHLHTVSSV